jgi:anti-sigma B factor antagonist
MEPSLVELTGEVDIGSAAALRERLDSAIARGGPVLVDASECTFVDLATVRVLDEYHRAARERSVPFALVLPFSAAPAVRRMLLELVPRLASFPIVPDRGSAAAAFGRSTDVAAVRFEPGRLEAVRASLWEAGWRREGLRAERDVLALEQRERLAEHRRRRK